MKMKLDQSVAPSFTTEELVSHHDVVFRAPVCDSTYGIPIGDGDTGCLLWLSEDTLHVQINDTALIDDIRGDTDYCSAPDETMTYCRNGAQWNLHFGCPVFETIYQDSFEARLSLANATASIAADTPFGKVRIRSFASHSARVAVLEVEGEFEEVMSIRGDLNRWGSRALMYWYSSFYDGTHIGLDGTSSLTEEGCLCLLQRLHGTDFCIAVKPVSPKPLDIRTAGFHAAQISLEEGEELFLTCYITVAVGQGLDSVKEKALGRIQEAENAGAEELYRTHAREWSEFWDKSYVSLPEKMDYLENLWYLNLYYANSEMRGAYPAHFCNGIWGSYHDFVPWGGYFHYNTQHAIAPLEAANHPELTETYYRFRREQLPYARIFAENIRKGKGAFYTDVCDMKGRMDRATKDNCTPGSQIAMAMYQHYRYTGDEGFLEQTALPVMRATAEYYLDKLVLGEDGCYHIHATNGYESPFVLTDDTITDLSMIRALFGALVTVVPLEEAAPYQERLEKLAPYQKADFLEDELDSEGRFLWGIGKGRKPLTNHVLSVGDRPRLPEDIGELPEYGRNVLREVGKEKARRTYGNPEHMYYGFPDTEMAPLFPAGVVGIKNRGSELYDMIYNSICLHSDKCMGWCMMPIYLARMGLTEMLEEEFGRMIDAWMIFPQGFGTYGPDNQKMYKDFWNRRAVRNGRTKEKSTSLQWKFNHFDYEPLPILATALNEMLLQSYDGILRLFPAIARDSALAFRLAAADGRIVDAVYQAGQCSVSIRCVRGGRLSMAVDHVEGPLSFRDGSSGEMLVPEQAEGIYTLDTVSGQRILVKSQNADSIMMEREYERNMDVKRFRSVKLGTEKEL